MVPGTAALVSVQATAGSVMTVKSPGTQPGPAGLPCPGARRQARGRLALDGIVSEAGGLRQAGLVPGDRGLRRVGLVFAAIYAAINQFTHLEFFAQVSNPGLKTFQYFSFTTLTTLGYGDYTAQQSGGQAVAVIEAMLGQIFLATLVARLVAGYRGTGPRQQSGPAAASPAQAVGHEDQVSHAQPAGLGDQASLAQADGPRNQADPALPTSPGRDPGAGPAAARLSPRALARQARRARLRSG